MSHIILASVEGLVKDHNEYRGNYTGTVNEQGEAHGEGYFVVYNGNA